MKKIREKLKRFQVSEKGFTLIELIVVIAIIGILAAIGTVAYSGYIESANQAADEQLAYDVSYAIQLGAMDEGITGINTEDEDAEDNGYVELTSEGMSAWLYIDGAYVQVLSSSFSDGESYYAQTLALDYDSLTEDAWGDLVDGWLTDGVGSNWKSQVLKSDKYTKNEDSDPILVYIPSGDIHYPDSDTKTLSETIAANLATYSKSTYYGSEEELMEAVEGVATAFGNLVGGLGQYSDSTTEELIAALLGYYDNDGWVDEEGWDEILASFGIEDGSEMTSEDVGNFMVMYMASLLTEDYTEDGVASTDAVSSLVESIVSSDSYSIDTSDLDFEEYTALFGAATAYYLSESSSDDYKSTYETYFSTMTSSESTFMGALTAASALGSIIDAMNAEIDEDSEYYSEGQLATDVASFMSLLSVMTESNSTGDLSLDLSNMSWDSEALAYLQELLDSM